MDAVAGAVTGTAVSLEEMLTAREERAARQAAALARFKRPLVSVTVVTPGPVKDGWLPRRVLRAAVEALNAMSRDRRWRVLSRLVLLQETGPEALYVMDVDARTLKAAMVELESQCGLGRLWDLDVIAPGHGQVSRQALGLPPRRCLICERSAHDCGRSRRHSLEELSSFIRRAVDAHTPQGVHPK